VPVFAMLAVCLIAVVALPALSLRAGWRARALWLTSVVLLGLAVVMSVYVVSEDDYRHDGRSRWTVYDAHVITVIAIVISVIAAAVAVASIRRRPTTWVVSLLGVVAVSVNFAALAEMGN
jgi:hypothetical protein